MSNKDGRPLNVEERTAAFVNSVEFNTMIQCFANNIVDDIYKKINDYEDKKQFESTDSTSSQNDILLQNVGGGGEYLKFYPYTNKKISIYLASDTPGMRKAFAERITAITTDMISEKLSLKNWTVEVDYFKESLPPAHFFLWTTSTDKNPLKEVITFPSLPKLLLSPSLQIEDLRPKFAESFYLIQGKSITFIFYLICLSIHLYISLNLNLG